MTQHGMTEYGLEYNGVIQHPVGKALLFQVFISCTKERPEFHVCLISLKSGLSEQSQLFLIKIRIVRLSFQNILT